VLPACLVFAGGHSVSFVAGQVLEHGDYLETRTDVLIKNEEVFRRWRRLGLNYMFLGLDALDEEGLRAFRKRSTPKVNNQALELARSTGMSVAVNIIADPDWDEPRFEFVRQCVRQWALSVPEIVNITVQTPYPGTETPKRCSRASTWGRRRWPRPRASSRDRWRTGRPTSPA
jgi:radical SAM superfamily enzyme YgiQ (UPF0313 family)